MMRDDMRDDGAPDCRLIWERRHTARRRHVCSFCGKAIEAGARYVSVGQLVDGRFECLRVHTSSGLCIDAAAVEPVADRPF